MEDSRQGVGDSEEGLDINFEGAEQGTASGTSSKHDSRSGQDRLPGRKHSSGDSRKAATRTPRVFVSGSSRSPTAPFVVQCCCPGQGVEVELTGLSLSLLQDEPSPLAVVPHSACDHDPYHTRSGAGLLAESTVAFGVWEKGVE